MKRTVVLAAALIAAAPAIAQIIPPAADPGAIQQRQLEEERRRREEERERLRPKTPPRIDVPAAPQPKAAPEGVQFLVREIRFTPSAILRAEELEAIAADYRGKRVSLGELQKLADRINELYRQKGVVTAQAVIPPQDVSEGVVNVRLIEGRVGRIRLQGNASTADAYITDRLRMQSGELVELKPLEDALVRFNRTNDVQLRAELKPGDEFATTDLYVTATEPQRWEIRATLDNTGTPSTGAVRSGLAYENRSLLGWRDDLQLSKTHADGQESEVFGYGVPFNPWGGRINYVYSRDNTAVVHGPTAVLNITGESRAHILSVRQPTLVTESWQLDVLGGGKSRYTSNWIDTVFLQRVDSSDYNVGAELQNFDAVQSWSVSYLYYRGKANTGIDNAVYSIGRGNARYSRQLPGPLTLRASFAWQSTGHQNLPSSELFFIGGEGSVRGYDTGTLAGDRGYIGNVELHKPLDIGVSDVGASIFAFGDYGNVTPFRPPNSTLLGHQHLTSVGLGGALSLGRSVFGRLTVGYGLTDVPNAPRPYAVTFQVAAIYF